MALVKVNDKGQSIDVVGRRNLMINGDMLISQRGTSTTGLKNTGGVYTLDRFSHRRGGTWTNFDAKHEQVDVTDTLPLSVGLTKALKVTCTTAEGSAPSGAVNAGESVGIGSYLERGDTHRLGVGSSSMSVSTLSFYVKASIATTYGISIGAEQHATSQRLQIPFTVSSANTYERISITIPTYNVALDSEGDHTAGWRIHWILDGITSGRTASQWNAHNDGTSEQVVILPNGVSTTGFSNTQNATFEITGVQLERGNVTTDFEHLLRADQLALCQRYFYRRDIGIYDIVAIGHALGDRGGYVIHTPVLMRAKPSVSQGSYIYCWYNNAGSVTAQNNLVVGYMATGQTNANQFYLRADSNSTVQTGYGLGLTMYDGSATSSHIALDSEL